MKKELGLKSQDSEIALYQKESQEQKENQPASLKQIAWARLFDIFLVSLFQFLPAYFFNRHQVGNWQSMGLTVGLGLIILISYFIILPLCLKGNTLGKLIFKLRLLQQNGQKPKWYMLVFRELYFWFIPWALGVLLTSVSLILYQTNPESKPLVATTKFLYNFGYVFFVLWYFFLAISIKLQKNHQSTIDLKFHLFVARKSPVKKVQSQQNPETSPTSQPTHLVIHPGLFNSEVIEALKMNETEDFNRSINLQDLDLMTSKKRLKPTTTLNLEQKLEKQNHEL